MVCGCVDSGCSTCVSEVCGCVGNNKAGFMYVGCGCGALWYIYIIATMYYHLALNTIHCTVLHDYFGCIWNVYKCIGCVHAAVCLRSTDSKSLGRMVMPSSE